MSCKWHQNEHRAEHRHFSHPRVSAPVVLTRAAADGQCYLDIYLTDEEYDQTTVAELASAATMLLETCVQRPPGRGGIVRLLGQ